MRYDEYLTSSEIILINLLKDKSRMEQDEIIGEWEDEQIR